ncbi:MAG TPA: hypothetical protein VE505_15695, partial [Vicinamibacterales bacterium]|nr:hypothetical protein [Vicinamibacterales bacterium]
EDARTVSLLSISLMVFACTPSPAQLRKVLEENPDIVEDSPHKRGSGLTGVYRRSVIRTRSPSTAENGHSVNQRTALIFPIVKYAMCSQAWELKVEDNGRWFEVLAWGVFTDRIVTHLGADPSRYTAIGVGYALERLAMLRYGIDDIRNMDVSRVA